MKKINRLWIIDDDPTYIFTTKLRLQQLSICDEIEVFDEGQIAFSEIYNRYRDNQQLPDVIFLDLNMPVWDGWDFLMELKKTDIQIPIDIYIITSSNNPDDRRKSEQFKEVKDFIMKPIDMEKIKMIFS